jgi:hypothetical protein
MDAATDQLTDVAIALESFVTWLRRTSQNSALSLNSAMSLSSLSALALLDTDGPLRVTQLAARAARHDHPAESARGCRTRATFARP